MPHRVADILNQSLGGQRRLAASPLPAPPPPPAPPGAPTAPWLTVRPDAAQISSVSGPLNKLLGGVEPTPTEWLDLGRQLAAMPSNQLVALNMRLAAAGAKLQQAGAGRYIVYEGPGPLAVSIDTATDRLRRTYQTQATVYNRRGAEVVMQAGNGQVSRRDAATTDTWIGALGRGVDASGRPIETPPAPIVPGEAARQPWRQALPSQFRMPAYTPNLAPEAFVAAVDAAVAAAGGRVLQPSNAATSEADWVNCFSYAFTAGQGDLGDPFLSGSKPRWLQSPGFQLARGGWQSVAPTQWVHVGDVVVYRDRQGKPSHAGIVRAVDHQGNPSAIESKFGAWGVYLHAPFDVLPDYGYPADFYRRPGQ